MSAAVGAKAACAHTNGQIVTPSPRQVRRCAPHGLAKSLLATALRAPASCRLVCTRTPVRLHRLHCLPPSWQTACRRVLDRGERHQRSLVFERKPGGPTCFSLWKMGGCEAYLQSLLSEELRVRVLPPSTSYSSPVTPTVVLLWSRRSARAGQQMWMRIRSRIHALAPVVPVRASERVAHYACAHAARLE